MAIPLVMPIQVRHRTRRMTLTALIVLGIFLNPVAAHAVHRPAIVAPALIQNDGKTAVEARRGADENGAEEHDPGGRHADVARHGDDGEAPVESDSPDAPPTGTTVVIGEGQRPPDEDSSETPTEEVPSDDDPGEGLTTYTSPTWGYVLTYDTSVWETTEASSEGGFDRLNLYNGPSYVWIWGMAGYSGDPVACRDDWVRVLRNLAGITDFAPLLTEDGSPIAGQDDGSAFAAYSYASGDGNEVFDVRCLTLVPGLGNLVIILETFSARYEEQVALVTELMSGLDVSGVREPEASELTGDPTDVEVGTVRRPADEDVDQIVIVDSFNNPDRGRLSIVSPDPTKVRYAYEDGEYVIETLDPNAGVWQAGIEGAYEDVAIALDVRLVGETVGRVIVLGCRYSLAGGEATGYALVADPAAGAVSLLRYDGEVVELGEAIASDAFLPAVEQNRLELSCVGSTIKAVVNGSLVATVEDERYASGRLFIAAGAINAPGTIEARFDDLLITIFGD